MFNRPRILIIRLSALGDVIHGLPLLCALRDHLPSAFLSWAVEGPAGDLLEGHTALNQLIRLPRGWLKSPRKVWELGRRLRKCRFDIAVDAQCLTKSALLSRLSGAPRRIGYQGVDGRELSRWLNNELVGPTATHVIDRNLQLLVPLGIENPRVRFQVPQRDTDADHVRDYLASRHIDHRFAVFHPGASWRSKLWPAERYAAVARHLSVEHGLPVLVTWGNPRERLMAQRLVDVARGPAGLAPALSVGQLSSLFRMAYLFIASDTGPLHLAVAVRTPSVGLYGPTPHRRNGPYGPEHLVIQEMSPEGESRGRQRTDNTMMMAIGVDSVCAACDKILERGDLGRTVAQVA